MPATRFSTWWNPFPERLKPQALAPEAEDGALLFWLRRACRPEPLATAAPACDWPLLAHSAERHLVGSLLWQALLDAGSAGLPPEEIRDTLRDHYHLCGLRNQVIRQRIDAIYAGCERKGVPLLLLKGGLLAFSAYSRPELRGMSDLDLLVSERDFQGLREVLEADGYLCTIPSLRPEDLPWYSQCFRQVRFQGRRYPPIEVHFRLFNLGIPAPVEGAWSDARTYAVGWGTVAAPSPERFLLHLCLHAHQHGFGLLRSFVDILRWTRVQTIDGPLLAELARSDHLVPTAAFALRYTAFFLDQCDESGLLERLGIPAWRRTVFDHLWQGRRVRALHAAQRRAEIELPRVYLLGSAPLRHKIRFLRKALFPPSSWLTGPHRGAARLHHLRRVLRLVVDPRRHRALPRRERGWARMVRRFVTP